VYDGITYLPGRFSPDINPMTLKHKGDLDMLKCIFTPKMKLLVMDEICIANEKKYENSSQGQKSKSNVTIFELLLPVFALTVSLLVLVQ